MQQSGFLWPIGKWVQETVRKEQTEASGRVGNRVLPPSKGGVSNWTQVFFGGGGNREHISPCQALPTHPTMSEHIRCRDQLPVKQTLLSTPEVPLQVAGRRSKSICSHAPLPRRKKEKLQGHRCRRHSEATQGPSSCCTALSVASHSRSLKPLFPRLQVPEARLSQRARQLGFHDHRQNRLKLINHFFNYLYHIVW